MMLESLISIFITLSPFKKYVIILNYLNKSSDNLINSMNKAKHHNKIKALIVGDVLILRHNTKEFFLNHLIYQLLNQIIIKLMPFYDILSKKYENLDNKYI